MKEPLILRAHDHKQFKGKRLWALLLGILLIFAMALYFYFSADKSNSRSLFSVFFQPGMGILFFSFYIPFARNRQILLTEEGIRFKSGYPKFLDKWSPNWKLSWDEITCASFIRGIRTSQDTLKIHTQNKTLILSPSKWMSTRDEKVYSNYNGWFTSLFGSQKLAKYLVNNGSLVTAFKERGLLQTDLEGLDQEPLGTDLLANPTTKWMVLLIIASIFYFLFDSISYKETYVLFGVPYLMIVSLGVSATLLAYLMLKRTSVKSHESFVLAILVGAAISLISSQLLLRVNEWTDSKGLQKVPYQLVEKAYLKSHWKSQNLQLPELMFDSNAEKYWNQFSIGDVKEFQLRKGGLGFYQLDLKPIEQDQKAFYE